MSELKHLKLEKTDGVARIIFDRPKHNVLNIEMMNELNGELENLIADDDLKCVVILGQGRSWCAGVEVGDHKPEMVDDMVITFNRIFELINKLDVPTIAAVHGACLGGGMEVAIACDIVIASEKAIFGQPEIKLGFFPPYAVVRLPELVGPAKAIEICTTGKNYTAEEAKSLGFVSQTVAEDDFTQAVDKLVKEIQVNSPLIIRLNKRAVKRHLGMSFPKAVEVVSDYFLNTLMKTEDTLEGIKSFEERRKAEWKNK
ncbi:enoyl-CoA hydratase/isomerase family protein [Desulfonema magnum]|uniref:Enoyl-CoA hydratase/isomerase n=1 Tax=Desulfonema magnum TaxID=45655 RepID=A0A975GQ43_9BACT|nr:enoyl-CoA hydratase/isomerase family protein [Desulfonema magnum]QTA89502.1 Enoyl-CoA hydratase/isomerase [Desulfonema magnum]